MKALKAAVFGEAEVKKKKRRIKVARFSLVGCKHLSYSTLQGANPLSCKKKKVDHSAEVVVRTGQRTASGKRKRSKRKRATAPETSTQSIT